MSSFLVVIGYCTTGWVRLHGKIWAKSILTWIHCLFFRIYIFFIWWMILLSVFFNNHLKIVLVDIIVSPWGWLFTKSRSYHFKLHQININRWIFLIFPISQTFAFFAIYFLLFMQLLFRTARLLLINFGILYIIRMNVIY